MTRFDRQIRFFGEEGQRRIANHCLAVVGGGGIGSIVLQQAAYLGVGSIIVIDHDSVEKTSLNRMVSLVHNDIYCSTGDFLTNFQKVTLARRMISAISPVCKVIEIPHPIQHEKACRALISADCIIGCVDNDAARLVLTEIARALDTPYLDLATDIENQGELRPGGRSFFCGLQRGCLACTGEIDINEASIEAMESSVKQDYVDIYGVEHEELGAIGPSVISLNGVVASIGMTEWLFWVTGFRQPKKLVVYRANKAIVTVNDSPQVKSFCYYCDEIRGHADHSYYLKDCIRTY